MSQLIRSQNKSGPCCVHLLKRAQWDMYLPNDGQFSQEITTIFSLLLCKAYREVNSHREKPFFITGNPVLIAGILFSLQGFPCKTLSFPVGDCSVCFTMLVFFYHSTKKLLYIVDSKLIIYLATFFD